MGKEGWEAIGVTILVLCLCVRNEEYVLLNVLIHLLLAVWFVWILSILFLTACSIPLILICFLFHEWFVRNG